MSPAAQMGWVVPLSLRLPFLSPSDTEELQNKGVLASQLLRRLHLAQGTIERRILRETPKTSEAWKHRLRHKGEDRHLKIDYKNIPERPSLDRERIRRNPTESTWDGYPSVP